MACTCSFFALIVCLHIVGNGHFSSLNFTSFDSSWNGLQSCISDVCLFSGTTVIFQCESHCLSCFFNAEEPLFTHICYGQLNSLQWVKMYCAAMAIAASFCLICQPTKRKWQVFNFSMAIILLLSGNVHPNPGPALTCGQQPLLKPDSALDVTIIPTLGDKHCFIHSLCISIASYLGINIPYHQLIHFLHKESQLHEAVYQPFFPNSAHLYCRKMINYFEQKAYNSKFCDFLPLMAANAFNIRLIVCSTLSSQIRKCVTIQPSVCSDKRADYSPYVALHLCNDHYSATKPSPVKTQNSSTARSFILVVALPSATACE